MSSLILNHLVVLSLPRGNGGDMIMFVERPFDMERFMIEMMRLTVGSLLALVGMFRGKPSKVSRSGISFLMVTVCMLFITVPSALATGPPEWVPPPNVLIEHPTRVLMMMTLRSEHLATKWQAEVAPVECEGPACTPEECEQSIPENGWKTVNEGEISAASAQVNVVHLGLPDAREGALAPVQLRHLQPETCYDARFSATNDDSRLNGKGELAPTVALIPFKTLRVESPEVPIGGADEEQKWPIFTVETTDVEAVASAKIETNGADTKYSFQYSLPEKNKAPSQGSSSWKVFSSDGEGTVSETEDFAKVTASTTGLSPETAYYVRIKMENVQGTRYQTVYREGAEEEREFFVTGTAAPGVGSVVVRNVTGASVHVSGQVIPHGSETSWRFESALPVSGMCPSSGWTSIPGGSGTVGQVQAEATPYNNAVPVGVGLTGLGSSKVYCVRLSVSNSLGSPVSGAVSFETEGAPSVDTFLVHRLFGGSVELLGTVNPKSVPTSEEQSIVIAGATGGSFTLSFDGATTAPIAWDATAENIEKALKALSSEPPVQVEGVAGGPYTVFFGGTDAGLEESLMSAGGSGLTPSSPASSVAVERVQQGGESNDTVYWFQYVSGKSFAEHGWVSPEETIQAKSGFGEVPQLVGSMVPGLIGGETYHFRLLAKSALSATVVGDEQELTVPVVPSVVEDAACPNEVFRPGLSASLPDCRAYEQLTPLEKGAAQEPFHYRGGIEAALVVGEEGEHAVLEASTVSYGTGTDSGQSPYLFSREEKSSAWSINAGSPQPETGVYTVTPQIYSSDVTQIAFESGYAPAEGASESPELEYKIGHIGGPYHKVISVPRKDVIEKTNRDFTGWVAANGDFSKLVLQTQDHDVLGAETGTLEGSDLYEYTPDGGVKQLNVKGSGEEATTIGSCGAYIVHGHEDPVDNHRASSSRAVSADGSRVFFEAVPGRTCSEPMDLYMRINGVETVDIGPYKFVAANPQGTELVLENNLGELVGYDTTNKSFETRSSSQVTEDNELGFLGAPPRFEPKTGEAFARPRFTYWAPEKGQASRYDDVEHVVECISCASPYNGAPKEAAYLGDVEGLPDLNGGLPDFRAVSANGEFAFFTTVSVLVKQDVDEEILPEFNGDTGEYINVGGHTSPSTDVYEWRAPGVDGCGSVQGCLALITDGRGGYLNLFLGTANEGHDVYFYTRSTLSPADHDPESSIGEGNVYDARIDGHAAERAPRPSECEGDACSTPPSPPVDSTPSSFTFTGNGNTVNEPAKAPVKKKIKKTKKKAKTNNKKKKKAKRRVRKAKRENARKSGGVR